MSDSEKRMADKRIPLDEILCLNEEKEKVLETESKQLCLSDWMKYTE